MANDNLTKARIAKIKNQIEQAGLTAPSLQDDLSLSEQEAILKSFLAENRTSGTSSLSEVRREADLLGVYYDNDTSEDALRSEVEETKARMKAASEAKMEARKESSQPAINADMLKDLAKEVGVAVARETSANRKEDKRVVSEREFDPNDLTEAVTYFAPMVYYKLPMKRVGGQLVEPPFGKVEFKMLDGSSVRTGDQNQTRYISSFTTDSKREQAYIETHHRFGKSFYKSDSMARITSEEHKYALKFGERMNMLRTYQAPELYRIAGDMRLPVDTGMSLDTLRDAIAAEQAKMDLIADKAHRQTLIEQSEREALLRRSAVQQS